MATLHKHHWHIPHMTLDDLAVVMILGTVLMTATITTVYLYAV